MDGKLLLLNRIDTLKKKRQLQHQQNTNNYEDDDNEGSQRSPSWSISSHSGGGADAVGGGVNSRKRKRGDIRGFGELAKAVDTFAKMYERMEFVKQRHAKEMERQRIKFFKDLELKQMQAFVDV
ncbi:hypothetical protein ABZP36_013130 [Zizania latifolia]